MSRGVSNIKDSILSQSLGALFVKINLFQDSQFLSGDNLPADP
jgi:hypothetical protein